MDDLVSSVISTILITNRYALVVIAYPALNLLLTSTPPAL